MNSNVLRFFLSATLYYVVHSYTGYFLVFPDYSIIGMSGFLPPLLGIMWGPVAAFGSLVGALLSEISEWYVMPQILQEKGVAAFMWQGTLLFCNCGLWAFIAAYMPWRLGYSLFINPEKPLFALRPDVIVKFVWLMFITMLTTSLFLGMTTDEADALRLIEGLKINLDTMNEYVLTCFLNDFGIAVFCGLMWFFLLMSYDYPFHRPKSVVSAQPKLQCAFDVLFIITIASAIILCQPQMVEYEKTRLFIALLLSLYMFRPMSPIPKESTKHEKIIQHEDIIISRKIAMLFYVFIFIVFLIMDVSGVIYGLKDINIWRQFNAECITMINLALIALLCMLLRYHHSIMTNIVLLEVLTVFISAFALGGVGFVIMDRVMARNIENSTSEMSIICRERLERTFDSIQVSVNDIRDLALAELESYELLKNDARWRQNYLNRTEHLFKAIASNTNGSVAFYLRLSPEFAGSLGGFSWGRNKEDSEKNSANSFYRRQPIDLSKYDPADIENVGWYYIPVSRHNATWIEPYIDPIVQNYVISYVSPLYVEDNLVGVVGMDIDFEYLIHEVRQLAAYNYGFAYLIDRYGRVLYHKNYKQGEVFIHNPEFREIETYLTNGIWIGIAIPMMEVYAERNNLLMHLVSVMLIVTVLASFFSIYFAARGVRPLVILTEAAQKIAKGNLNVQLPNESRNELGTLVKSIREMVSKLEIYVYRDKLTGLSNTTAYARKCNEIAEQSDYLNYAVVVFDVNFLKKINDTYGHEAGNELIRCAASIISKTFAESPVFRIGGDEFVAILEGRDYEQRNELLELFDEAVAEKHFTVQDKTFNLSVARGISIGRKDVDYASVFQEADEAMYVHKTAIKKKLGIQR